MSININFLRIPLSWANDLLDTQKPHDHSMLLNNNINDFKEGYTPDELKGIENALKWAVENSNHDFKSMLNTLSKYENKDLHNYLCAFHKMMIEG